MAPDSRLPHLRQNETLKELHYTHRFSKAPVRSCHLCSRKNYHTTRSFYYSYLYVNELIGTHWVSLKQSQFVLNPK